MKSDLMELEKDFKEMLSCIDFKHYDPYSKLFMRVLFTGQMYMCVKSLEMEDDVEEELDGAKKYMLKFLETDNEIYKEMAKDELKHAGNLIKIHYLHADDKEKEELEERENERQEILSRLSKWTKE